MKCRECAGRSSFLQEKPGIVQPHRRRMSDGDRLRAAFYDLKQSSHQSFPVWLPVYTGTRLWLVILVTHLDSSPFQYV